MLQIIFVCETLVKQQKLCSIISAFVLMTVIMQKSPMSYQNWSIPSSKMLIMDSCARELNTGNNKQIFMAVKNPSFQELVEVLTQDLHDYSAAKSRGFGQLCFGMEQIYIHS